MLDIFEDFIEDLGESGKMGTNHLLIKISVGNIQDLLGYWEGRGESVTSKTLTNSELNCIIQLPFNSS